MKEQLKLEEARYFYEQMKVCQNEYQFFRFNLSAFLSAARSVLQYAIEEAKVKVGGHDFWEIWN